MGAAARGTAQGPIWPAQALCTCSATGQLSGAAAAGVAASAAIGAREGVGKRAVRALPYAGHSLQLVLAWALA